MTSASRPFSFVVVSYTYPPVWGGSEVEAQRVCAEMQKRGHRVVVLCTGGAPMPETREWTDPEGVAVRILTRKSRVPWKDRVFAWQVAWYLWRHRREYEVVYFLMQGLHLAAGLPVARLLGKSICMKFSGSAIITPMRESVVGRLELAWLRRWAGRIMVLNDGMVEEAVACGIPKQQLLWMPNPVDTDAFRPATAGEKASLRRSLGVPDDVRVVLYTGRLSPEKGLVWLLRAFARAARDLPGVRLVLVGNGPQEEELRGLATELHLGPDRLHFAGRVPIPEVARWLRVGDVFSLLSPNEGFSCSLLEAMSAGLPGVVSDIPANRQLVRDGVHGRLTPVGDVDAAAAALRQILEDARLRARMSTAARQSVLDQYSTPQVAARYEQLFAELQPKPIG